MCTLFRFDTKTTPQIVGKTLQQIHTHGRTERRVKIGRKPAAVIGNTQQDLRIGDMTKRNKDFPVPSPCRGCRVGHREDERSFAKRICRLPRPRMRGGLSIPSQRGDEDFP
jgi:hypothetical protein